MIRVVVADDHPVVREGVAAILADQPDIIVVGQAADGQEAIDLYRSLQPDVVMVDLQMPGTSGLDATSCNMQPRAIPTSRSRLISSSPKKRSRAIGRPFSASWALRPATNAVTIAAKRGIIEL